jgi:hypothetical protein
MTALPSRCRISRCTSPGLALLAPRLVTASVRRLEDTLVDVPEKKAQQ